MTDAAGLSLWVAVPVSLLLLLGAGLALAGAIGLLRLPLFYERIHALTLGTTLGIGCILLASMLFFSVLQSRPVLHELLIGMFTVITAPVTLILLVHAALCRDRREASTAAASGSPTAARNPAVGSGRSVPR